MKRLLAATLVLGLAACASAPKKPDNGARAVAGKTTDAAKPHAGKMSPYPPAQEDLGKRGHYTAGGLYAPHIADSTPDVDIDVSLIPEPDVVEEPRSRYGNRPTYSVLGKSYRVLEDTQGYVEKGTASFYGNKFHGRRTSNMEVYDLYAFTAAHKSLPLPSFARVTNLDNGESVVVRVNDRGPFHEGRVIDLSYAAALKLGITRAGTGRVEVRALHPGENGTALASKRAGNETSPTSAIAPPKSPAPASSMDTLVAALPAADRSTGALSLPPGVRIATGKPTRLDHATTSVATGTAATSVTMPATPLSSTTSPSSSADESWRFDMNQDGRAMTADEFDTWMTQRKVRVATGRTAAQPAPSTPVTRLAATAAPAAPVAGLADHADNVTLQVASFAARDNADRALAILRGAGIDRATLHDATANGQRVWRLRVGPLEAAAASGLANRIAGLGFGAPQRVNE
ncbi:MAG: septal ring lytic transglycosylase RlpA family protein [Lysobacter sp.]